MAKKQRQRHPRPRLGPVRATDLIKVLEKVTAYGHRGYEIYRDWLELVEATTAAIPAHMAALHTSGTLASDTPETQALWARLRAKYKPEAFSLFAEAFAVLMESVDRDDPVDLLGDVYMEFGAPSSWHGQFFTPFHLAEMMARLTVDPDAIQAEVYQRLRTALDKTPLAQALTESFGLLTQVGEKTADSQSEVFAPGRLAQHWWLTAWPVMREHYQPVTINDPCCGSGVMFLAVAKCLPRWMTDWGLVQFYGQDLDYGCVLMARINCRLYGLGGSGAQWQLGAELLANKLTRPPNIVAKAPDEPASEPHLRSAPTLANAEDKLTQTPLAHITPGGRY